MALVAAFVISAVASASASATPADLKVNKVERTSGEGNVAGKQVGSSELKVAGGGTAGPEIVCKNATIGAGSTIKVPSEDAVTSTVVITFENCEVVNNATVKANCKVEAIKTEAKGQAATLSGAEGKVVFEPKSGAGGAFATVVINNNSGKTCSFKTSGAEVKGTQECKLPSAMTEASNHKLKCEPVGSTLTYASKTATFNAEAEFELTSFTGLTSPFEFSLVAS